jgi:hypothetical protein
METNLAAQEILTRSDALKRTLDVSFRDKMVESIYADAEAIANRVVHKEGTRRFDLDQRIDSIVTSKVWGLPLMGVLLAGVFWVTIVGANVPSDLLATALFWIEDQGSALFELIGLPWWITGFLWHGIYRGLAWVVSVMLPPMAIFFPIFTILEDLGYLPRVAFNVDKFFKAAGAHGKQALTMSMGLGCNAAGVIACRVIDSPRERLIAILTNNFMPCNGRWPTLIMLASIFVAAAFPPAFAAVAAAGSLLLIVLIGAGVTLIPAAQHLTGTVHLYHRSHPVCALASGGHGRAGRRLDLADEQRTCFGAEPDCMGLRLAQPRGHGHWARRRHSAGLHHRHTGERNRGAYYSNGLYQCRHDASSGQPAPTAATTGWATRLDLADGYQLDALCIAAQSLLDYHLDDLQRD